VGYGFLPILTFWQVGRGVACGGAGKSVSARDCGGIPGIFDFFYISSFLCIFFLIFSDASDTLRLVFTNKNLCIT
jgi:hypothetical protein